MRNYGIIAKPLNSLLKKGPFLWSKEANKAFERLKLTMITTLVLQLLDFEKPFIVETYANYHGIGAVLMQESPLIDLGKALGHKSVGLSIYEKEFLAVLLAVE